MPNEGKLATRMRQEGRICCLCSIPLAPPHPMAERFCVKCGVPHRVYLHATHSLEDRNIFDMLIQRGSGEITLDLTDEQYDKLRKQ
jgi:hypothetical protein